jgi:L-iditol 2-dehydrogenase
MYYANNDVRVQQMPVPKIGEGEILVKIHASGICGSDVLEWYRKDRTPLVLGHEIGAQITQIGEGIKKYKIGQRVTAAHHLPCNECHFCKSGHTSVCETLRKTNFSPGGFCEYCRLSAIHVDRGVFPLSDNVSYEEATFVEPLACVLRGQRTAGGVSGKSVLIIGSGVSGCLHIKLARALGASLIVATDINGFRLDFAKKIGADFAVNAKDYLPDVFKDKNKGLLADMVIVCTGASAAIEQALNSVERGGTILFFAPVAKDAGVTMPFNRLFWRNEITLTSSYAANPDEQTQALKLISNGRIKVDDLITHRLPLDKIGDGFKLVAEAKDSLKVIIEPQK